MTQLHALLSHAQQTVPYYRNLIGANRFDAIFGLTPDIWRALPILTRTDIQDNGADLRSERIPKSHYPLGETQTFGSTGQPVKVMGSAVSRIFWSAVTMRDHYWRKRLALLDPRHRTG